MDITYRAPSDCHIYVLTDLEQTSESEESLLILQNALPNRGVVLKIVSKLGIANGQQADLLVLNENQAGKGAEIPLELAFIEGYNWEI